MNNLIGKIGLAELDATQITILLTVIAAFLGAFGFSLAFKDYVASFMAGVILRDVRHIRPGRRIKVMSFPNIKGDVVTVGPLRTTIIEVGDGERLPSVQTGRIVKIPNFMLFNNAVMLYGDTIVDEVVAYVKGEDDDIDLLLEEMRRAIEGEGHRVIEIGVYQREASLAIHGIFEATTNELTDLRSRILTKFLKSVRGKRAKGPIALPIQALRGDPARDSAWDPQYNGL